jgi:hypothetical protein
MWITFFFFFGIIHHEFGPGGTTVNAAYCAEMLSCLWDSMRRKDKIGVIDGFCNATRWPWQCNSLWQTNRTHAATATTL